MTKRPIKRSRQTAKRPRKLKSGAAARAVPEWIGKTPDSWPPPPAVRLRIVMRQGGKDPVTGRKFGPNNRPQFDHIVRLADGGENRESNIQALSSEPHAEKTKREAAAGAQTRKRQLANLGIKSPPKRALESRNDLATRPETGKTTGQKRKAYEPGAGTPALMRRGFVSAAPEAEKKK